MEQNTKRETRREDYKIQAERKKQNSHDGLSYFYSLRAWTDINVSLRQTERKRGRTRGEESTDKV